MELSKMNDCRADILRAAQIQILAKDCLKDAGFSPILTTNKAMLMRFKRTRDNFVNDLSENDSKVARLGVPGWLLLMNLFSCFLLFLASFII
jgi:hypothetical protein